MYRRCPSAKRVSNASELLPEPLKPVITTSWLSGRSRSKFFKLLCRTPRRRITRLADGFDMQAECNGVGGCVNGQIPKPQGARVGKERGEPCPRGDLAKFKNSRMRASALHSRES